MGSFLNSHSCKHPQFNSNSLILSLDINLVEHPLQANTEWKQAKIQYCAKMRSAKLFIRFYLPQFVQYKKWLLDFVMKICNLNQKMNNEIIKTIKDQFNLFHYLSNPTCLSNNLLFEKSVMDENQECVICHQFNDQMLMLQCIHDPCINCAAIHYAEEFKGKLKNYYYTCQLCGERTALDISSVIQLQKLAPKRPEEPVSIKKPNYRDVAGMDSSTSLARKDRYDVGAREVPRDARSDSYKEPYLPRRDTPPPETRDHYGNNQHEDIGYHNQRNTYSKKSAVRTCKDHADEQVSYYCFKCYENICPECAIHGSHQGHDVKATKKAIVDVKKQFGLIIDSIARNQDDLRKNKDHFSRKIKELHDETNKQKAFVSKQFEILRAQLMTKEREYLRELDDINHRNASILSTQIDLINKQSEESNKLIRNIEQTLKKDEVTVLDEFGKKSQSYSNEVEKMSVSQVGYSNVPGLKQANLSDLKQITSTINCCISEQGIRTEDIAYNA